MKVFVAGATGVIGRRAVDRLIAAGAEVSGIARRADKAAELEARGVTAVSVSLFDRDALHLAVSGHDVVVNLATAIPSGSRANSLSAWDENHRIRREGARNLVDAALAAGVGRYVQESIAMLYADGGEHVLDEFAPVAPTWVTESALDAEAQASRFAERGGAGVALRFAYFYGADSAHTLDAIAAARAGRPVELGPDAAFRPTVTTDDAAEAVVAALTAPSGTYNVADDRPLRRSEHVEALSQAFGGEIAVPGPVNPPLSPEFSMLLRSQRISSGRFQTVTGWRPRSPSAWEGWRTVIAELTSGRAVAAS